MSTRPRPALMLDVLREHLDEIDFLWEQREASVFAPDWTLRELAAHEERTDAHLPGLRLGEGHTVDLAREALAGEEKGAATAATFALMAFDADDLCEDLVAALATALAPVRDGVRIGLRHVDIRRITPHLQRLVTGDDAALAMLALDVLAFHRVKPEVSWSALPPAADPALLPLFWEAIGRLGGPWRLDLLENALAMAGPSLHRAALETSARVTLSGLERRCREAVTDSRGPAEAVRFLGVFGDARDLPALEALLPDPQLGPAAARAMGAIGDARAIPALLRGMADATLGPSAGAAFVQITGAEVIEGAEAVQPDETAAPPPDPAPALAWWESARSRFAPGLRFQAGRDVSREPLGPIFDHLPLAIRRDLYFGARATSASAPDLELELRAALQKRARGRA